MKLWISTILLLACPWLATAIEPEATPSLARVKRIYVERLGGGSDSDQMRDMIIAAVQNSKLFMITDNVERADATLRGSSDDKIFTDEHSSSDSIGIHATSGSGSSDNNATGIGTSTHQNTGAGITDSESSHIRERRHESSASIRLIDIKGDVIWSTTQESAGGKFRGAMADVADKVARQLADDTKKARAAVVPCGDSRVFQAPAKDAAVAACP
jgi:hypothetical protein